VSWRNVSFALFAIVGLSCPVFGQDDTGWHISPVQINILTDEARPLQLLDDSHHELKGATWVLDNPELATLVEEGGREVLHPKKAGTVRVIAVRDGESRTREITIWPGPKLPMGTIMWGLKPFGLSQSQLPAAPGGGGPDLFVLSQDSGAIYLQGLSADGIQLSSWTFPESTRKVEMICTDDLGGAIIAAQHQDSYTIYVVGKDGKLRWRHTFAGIRVGYALNYEGLLHLLNQAPDHKSSTLTVWDEAAGTEKFTLTLPESHENELNVQSSGGKLLCVPGRSISNLLESKTSGLFVNTDGDAYLAFTLFNWTVSAKKCPAGSVMDSHNVSFSENDKTVLWRVHPDGSYKETVVEQTQRANLPEGTPLPVASPTGAIIPDGFGGVLLSMRWMQSEVLHNIPVRGDQFVYRITQDGEVAYKFPLPKFAGPLHDAMVLGELDTGFATRGGVLIAFDVKDGNETWHWDSGASEIEVFAATAGGGCAVRTPRGVIQVEKDGTTKELFLNEYLKQQ
jgi:outer membrane protein assembly factor BamB